MDESEPLAAMDAEAKFRADAERAGIVVPPRHDVSPWVVVGLSCALIAAALGVGYATGWLNPSGAPGTPATPTLPSSCSSYFATLHGAVLATATPTFNASFSNLTNGYTANTNQCIGFVLNGSDPAPAIASLAAGSTTFVFAPMPLTADQVAAAGAPVDQIPLLVRGVTIAYNPTNLPAGLQLSAAALAGIFLGTVTQWNAPAIVSANPGADLSGAPAIVPVVLAGTSPTTYGFSHFLAEANASWSASVGYGGEATGPAGVAVDGDAAALAKVAATPGAIGYWEAPASPAAGVDVAAIENPSGKFATPTVANVTIAAESIGYETPGLEQDWTNVTFGNATASDAYPVVELGFADLYSDVGKAYHGTLSTYDAWWLLEFFNWVASHGDVLLGPLGFVTLPPSLTALDGFMTADVAYNGYAILGGPNQDNETGEGGETGEF